MSKLSNMIFVEGDTGIARMFSNALQQSRLPATMKSKTNKPKPRTSKQRANARANHWRKSGVSDSTIAWMKATGNL